MCWERNRKFLVLIVSLIFFFGCNKTDKKNSLTSFIFPQKQVEEGVVNKYYVYQIPKNSNEDTRVNISYSGYKIISDTIINITGYNAGLQAIQFQEIIQKAKELQLSKYLTIYRGDTNFFQIIAPQFFSFNLQEMKSLVFERKTTSAVYRFKREVFSIKDTLFENLEAKIVTGNQQISIPELDSIIENMPLKLIYAKNLGLVFSTMQSKTSLIKTELIEQMPISKFNQLKQHNKNRIGFIDPSNVIDKGSGFEICGKQQNIADYYNSDPDGGFYPNKRHFLNSVYQQIDSSLLDGASGYLTFRFVINCKGEAGWFTTEMASLDFEKNTFQKPLVMHLFEILKMQKLWTPSILRGKETDEYFYVTFKFKNGKLETILP